MATHSVSRFENSMDRGAWWAAVHRVIRRDVNGPTDCLHDEVSYKEKNKYCAVTHIRVI